jgi:hypothetical protein
MVTAAWNALTGLTRAAIRLATVTMTPTGSTTVRSGVIPGGTPLLLTGSAMTGSVAPGRAVVQGTSAQGAYPVVVDAATAITVPNGHASLPRIDTVWLVVGDQDYDTSGVRQAAIVYQQGTAAASPTAPTAPTGYTAYLRLWDITVPANASSGSPINWVSALTDQRVYTVPVGGITPGAAAGSYAGQWRDAGGAAGILERYSGSAWEAAVRLGNSGLLSLGDVSLSRTAAGIATLAGGLVVTGVGGTVSAYKTTAQDAPSTTLVNDSQLFVTVAANAVYEFDGWLWYAGAAPASSSDLVVCFSIPAGATMTWARFGSPVNDAYNMDVVTTDHADTSRPLGTFAVPVAARPGGRLITAGTGGTVQLRFSQGTSRPGSPSTMQAGSWIRFRRVA